MFQLSLLFILSLFLHLTLFYFLSLPWFFCLPDPCDPVSFPGVPGLGKATNTISVISFAACMKEKKSWLSKPPQCYSKENATRHMTWVLGLCKWTAPQLHSLTLQTSHIFSLQPSSTLGFSKPFPVSRQPLSKSLPLPLSPWSVTPSLMQSQMGWNYCIIKSV